MAGFRRSRVRRRIRTWAFGSRASAGLVAVMQPPRSRSRTHTCSWTPLDTASGHGIDVDGNVKKAIGAPGTSRILKARVVRDGSMCYIPLTFDPKAVFGKVRAPVKVTLNG